MKARYGGFHRHWLVRRTCTKDLHQLKPFERKAAWAVARIASCSRSLLSAKLITAPQMRRAIRQNNTLGVASHSTLLLDGFDRHERVLNCLLRVPLTSPHFAPARHGEGSPRAPSSSVSVGIASRDATGRQTYHRSAVARGTRGIKVQRAVRRAWFHGSHQHSQQRHDRAHRITRAMS
jgi:hypothetical protein